MTPELGHGLTCVFACLFQLGQCWARCDTSSRCEGQLQEVRGVDGHDSEELSSACVITLSHTSVSYTFKWTTNCHTKIIAMALNIGTYEYNFNFCLPFRLRSQILHRADMTNNIILYKEKRVNIADIYKFTTPHKCISAFFNIGYVHF